MIINNKYFNLKQIAESGQCFRWRSIDEHTYIVPAFNNLIILHSYNEELNDKNKYLLHENDIYLSCNEDEYNNIWKEYFDLTRDYSDIERRINNSSDEHLKESFRFGSGIRILKQDLWEMIFSFMISQNNNIKRISKSIDLICKKSGHNYIISDDIINSLISIGLDNELINDIRDAYNSTFRFPECNDIDLKIFDDTSLGLGYRAPYLKGLCEFVINNPEWIDGLRDISYEDAINKLISIKGIGIKVANCVCLFGLNHLESFPVDTHVRQLLEKYYPDGIDLSLYPEEAGIIQQYLFYYELVNK